jgi:hypothetical protein
MPPWDFFQKPSSCGLDKEIQISNITSSDKQHPYLIFWEQTFKRLSEACSLDIIFNFFLSSLSASRLERLDMNGWALELITVARNAYGFQCISARSGSAHPKARRPFSRASESQRKKCSERDDFHADNCMSLGMIRMFTNAI